MVNSEFKARSSEFRTHIFTNTLNCIPLHGTWKLVVRSFLFLRLKSIPHITIFPSPRPLWSASINSTHFPFLRELMPFLSLILQIFPDPPKSGKVQGSNILSYMQCNMYPNLRTYSLLTQVRISTVFQKLKDLFLVPFQGHCHVKYIYLKDSLIFFLLHCLKTHILWSQVTVEESFILHRLHSTYTSSIK